MIKLSSIPFRNFYSALAALKREDKTFGTEDLKRLHYCDLILAASGNAGPARCSIELVTEEKRDRRNIFTSLTPVELDECVEYLDKEGMVEDVHKDRIRFLSSAPEWNSLSSVSKLYFKLNCVENHPNQPTGRFSDVVDLLASCLEESALPQQPAFNIKMEFQHFLLSTNLSDDFIKDVCTRHSNFIYGFIPGDECEVVDKLELKDYICSAGCFFPIGE
jgi:hypothetical protein